MRMLEFVHVTGSAAGGDVDTRRKVRSQAMKDFRRRQREERVSKAKQTEPTIVASKSRGQRRRSSTEQSQNLFQNPRDCTASRRKRSSKSSSSTSNITLSHLSPAIIEHSGSCSSIELDQVPLSTYDTSTSRDQSPSQTSSGPSSDGLGATLFTQFMLEDDNDSGLLESSNQFDHMIGFCQSYMQWLHPGIDISTAVDNLCKTWTGTDCSILLAACCLASAGHLDSIETKRPGGDYEVYKAQVLREVSKRMQSPCTAVNNDTLACLACLLSFEMSRGSAESATHLQGIKSIIELKGGLEALGPSGTMPMMLECLDLLHAIMFRSQPILAKSDVDPQHRTNPEAFKRLTRLLITEHNEMQTSYPDPYSKRLSWLVGSIKDATAALENLHDDQADQTAARLRQSLERAREMSIDMDPDAPDAHYLSRICYLKLLVLYNLTIHNLGPGHESNQAIMYGMIDTLRKIQDSTWQRLPYLRIWILLSGLDMTVDLDKKSFFNSQLVRATYQLGVSEWRRVRNFILRFIDTRDALKAMRPDNDIVTPDHADESWLVSLGLR